MCRVAPGQIGALSRILFWGTPQLQNDSIKKCHLDLQPLLVRTNQMNNLFQQWNKPFTDDMELHGPGDVLGAGSVSPLVTNFSIDPVMTLLRNVSYKQIIKIRFHPNR